MGIGTIGTTIIFSIIIFSIINRKAATEARTWALELSEPPSSSPSSSSPSSSSPSSPSSSSSEAGAGPQLPSVLQVGLDPEQTALVESLAHD
jgi:cytoskeletal protein RodZ